MSNKKESSIEWLFLMMYNPNYGYEANQRLLDKAKQLHKQEIMEAYLNGVDIPELAEQIKETYETDN